MALNQVIQNKYEIAAQEMSNPVDFGGFPAQESGRFATLARRLRLTSRRRIFALGGLLLLGTMVFLGVLTLALGETSAQQMGMSPAAERYWRNLDVAQVQKDMKGWSREDLAKLFLTIREQTSDPETRKNINYLGRMLRLPGFESSSSLLTSLLSQPVFILGIFLSIGIWGAAIVISIAPHVRWGRAPAPVIDPALFAQSEQSTDAILEELLSDITLESVEPDSTEKKEEEKKAEEQPASEQSEESSSGLGDLASLFEEEDTSITALEQFCKNLADIVVDDLAAKAKEFARDLKAYVNQSARASKQT